MSIFNEQNPMKSIEKENLSTLWNKIKSYVNSKIPTGSLAGKNVAPIEMGGTDATTSKDARVNLGITYGTSIPTEAPTTGDGTVYFFEDGMESDYVVEINTSDIWTYRKWNSGIAECWGEHQFNIVINTAWGNGYTGNVPRIAYPITFTERPKELATLHNYAYGAYLAVPGNISTDYTKTGAYTLVRPITAGTDAQTYILHYYVIGKWR